jgi:hypothetical protein
MGCVESDRETVELKLKLEKEAIEAYEKELKAQEALQKKTEQRFNGIANSIGRSFDQAFKGMISGTQSFEKTMLKLADSLLNDFLEVFLKMGEKWLATHIEMLAAHSSFLSSIFGLDQASNAAKQATSAAAAVSQVTQQAGIAGAAGFASAMSSLPFPINIAVAPGVMAAAIAETMGNVGLASAAGGMYDVPERHACADP